MTLNMVGICRGDRVGKAINSRRVNTEHTAKRCIYKYAIANESLTDSKLMAKGQILIVGWLSFGRKDSSKIIDCSDNSIKIISFRRGKRNSFRRN